MKPTANKILAKLENQKIDLTAAGDAQKLITISNQLMKQIDKEGSKYLKLRRSVHDNGYKLLDYFDLMSKTEDKLIKGAKDLGIPTPDLADKLAKNMDKILRMRKTYTF